METETASNLWTLNRREEQNRTKWLSDYFIFGAPGKKPFLRGKKAQGAPLALNFCRSGGLNWHFLVIGGNIALKVDMSPASFNHNLHAILRFPTLTLQRVIVTHVTHLHSLIIPSGAVLALSCMRRNSFLLSDKVTGMRRAH